ncbi:hypothetical protein BH24CHL4_BH24CHL4_21390 [soil metagenome]
MRCTGLRVDGRWSMVDGGLAIGAHFPVPIAKCPVLIAFCPVPSAQCLC